MDYTGLIVAIFVSIIFILKFIMACFGFDTDSMDDIDVTENGITSSTFGLTWSDVLSLKGFLHFMFGFSWSWACFGINEYFSLIAVLVGIICVILLAFTYKLISKLDAENKNEPLTNLLGRTGTVYATIKNDSTYKKILCQIVFNNKLDTIECLTTEKVSVGDNVRVTTILNGNLIVNKL